MVKEIFDVQVKARKIPRFKAGSDLAGKVNLVAIEVDQASTEDEDFVSVNLKWIQSKEENDCDS